MLAFVIRCFTFVFFDFFTYNMFLYVGHKLTVSGSTNGTLQGADCKNDFYQPFKFLSSGNSRCVYKKSFCSEDGQVAQSNGTLKKTAHAAVIIQEDMIL